MRKTKSLTSLLTAIFVAGFFQSTDLQANTIAAVMTSNPISLRAEQFVAEALRTMESRNINGVLVTDKGGYLVGALKMLDLVHARLV